MRTRYNIIVDVDSNNIVARFPDEITMLIKDAHPQDMKGAWLWHTSQSLLDSDSFVSSTEQENIYLNNLLDKSYKYNQQKI